MADQPRRLEDLRRSHRHSTTQQTTVQFFADPAEDEDKALWVVVDGVAYRREPDAKQPETLAFLRGEDLKAAFLEKYGLEAFDALFEIELAHEETRDAEWERTENMLVGYLPRHEKAIRYCFCPDDPEYDLTVDDLREQAPCLMFSPNRPGKPSHL